MIWRLGIWNNFYVFKAAAPLHEAVFNLILISISKFFFSHRSTRGFKSCVLPIPL